MQRLIVLSMLVSAQAFGWTCDDPSGLVQAENVLKTHKECMEGACQYTVTAPHSLEDRAFSGFDLSREQGGITLLSVSLSHRQRGADFYTKLVVKHGYEEGVSVTANYANFNYGCALSTTLQLDET